MISRTKYKQGKSLDIFGKYAEYYDIVYQDKDYYAEALFVSELIKKNCHKTSQIRVLDLACGTGLHAIELAKMGYEVDASDISEKMINMARENARLNKLKITFHQEAFQTADRINKKFDVVFSMFSAINYLTSWKDLLRSLKNIHGLLENDGILIFDFWNGNAVIEDFASVRVKRMNKGTKSVLRYSENTIDRLAQIVNVKFNFMLFDKDRLASEFTENHILRYFFVREMEDFLEISCFKIIHKCPFMSPKKTISYNDWNVIFVVKKSSTQDYLNTIS
jgi:2-polyprenyl-3-methyl-5-hydroxy-6-metoxy-1,4-benzoquinol methylase